MNKEARPQRSHSRVLIGAVVVAWFLGCVALAQSPAPGVIAPESLHWTSPPNVAGLQSAWVVGAEQQPGLYLLRVKLAAGTKIPPHTHPDRRTSTVLKGTIYVGFGETFDEAKMVPVPAGAVYVAPAKMPHYIWAKEGPAQYQESGIGPTGTAMLNR